VPLLGREMIGRWNALAAAGAFRQVVEELLDKHYDPLYARSIRTNFPAIDRAVVVSLPGIDATAYHAEARRLVEELAPCR
jgi:tRNA 2-selenouridine synthase